MKYWKRRGLFYYSYLNVYGAQGKPFLCTVEHKFDFVTYHLIRLIHGEKELERIATARLFK